MISRSSVVSTCNISVRVICEFHAHLSENTFSLVFAFVQVALDKNLFAFVNNVLDLPVVVVTVELEFRIQL